MAVNYATALKATRMTAVRDAIDAGSGPGTLEICSAAYAAILATIPFEDPSGSVSGGVLTLDTSPALADTSADNTGTAAIARIKDSSGTVVAQGLTVGTTGTDIVLSSTSIVSGDSVTITSGTLTHAA